MECNHPVSELRPTSTAGRVYCRKCGGHVKCSHPASHQFQGGMATFCELCHAVCDVETTKLVLKKTMFTSMVPTRAAR